MKVLLVWLVIVGVTFADKSDDPLVGPKGLTCSCGKRNIGRIVGGTQAKQNEYPWMVNLSVGCGGSIITPRHVLTAAHCTYGIFSSFITISVGMHREVRDEGDKEKAKKVNVYMKDYDVRKVIFHEDYRETHGFHDISILVTFKDIEFNAYVAPVCLPSSKYPLVGKYVKVLGWGKTESTVIDNTLREVDLKVINREECEVFWPDRINQEDTQFCTYFHNKDSCDGDSGGPVVYLDPDTNRFTQVGVVSFGSKYCGAIKPSVNTDVFTYLDWIKNAIAETVPSVGFCTKTPQITPTVQVVTAN